MINLLPNTNRRQLRAARTNVILLKCLVFLGLAIAFLALACYVTYQVLSTTKSASEQLSKSSTTTSSKQTSAANASANLLIASSILSQQISYNSIITGLGSVLPTGTMLDSIALNENSFDAPITLNILATSANLEPTLKNNFQNSSLFKNYTLNSSVANPKNVSNYSTIISVNVTINKAAAK